MTYNREDIMKRHALSDYEWDLIKDQAAYKPKRGPKPKHVRLMLDGIFWVLATGAPWRDLPAHYGAWDSVYSRFRTYVNTGILERIIETLLHDRKAGDTLKLKLICMDGTYIRAHKHAAGARKKKAAEQ